MASYVKRKPGAGKSILMKSLFSNTKESAKVISFFKDIGEHAVDVKLSTPVCTSAFQAAITQQLLSSEGAKWLLKARRSMRLI